MAFTLGFHIILACLGVALPAMMLIANYIGLRKGDEVALELAQRWSKVVAVPSRSAPSPAPCSRFEFGLLWPAFTERFGDVFGIAVRDRGDLLLPRGDLHRDLHLRLEAAQRLGPLLDRRADRRSAGIGGAFSVVAVNSWMNQPQGFTLDAAGNVTDIDPLKVIFNPATGYEVPHMILAAYMVTGFLVASVYAVGMLRGPARPPPPARPADPADDRLHR